MHHISSLYLSRPVSHPINRVVYCEPLEGHEVGAPWTYRITDYWGDPMNQAISLSEMTALIEDVRS